MLLSVWLVGQKDVRIGAGVDRTCLKNPTKLISEPEFWERFHILNGISIHLVDGALTSIEKGSPNVIFLARNNLTQGSSFPFLRFSNNSSIIPKFLRISFIRMLSGC